MHSSTPVAALSGTVLITGGGGGIGAATARELSEQGVRVVILDRSLEAAETCTASLHGQGHVAAAVDVCDRDAVYGLVQKLVQEGHEISGLVNCAGTITRGAAEQFDVEAWRKELDIHLTGSMLISQAAFDELAARNGSIVNLASVGAILGLYGRLAYSTAKAGILGLTRTLASEWGRAGVRVNAVAPGYVMTPMVESGLKNGTLDQSKLVDRIPLGRLAEPEEIASAIVFLLSKRASYFNGSVLCADGGLTIDGKFD